MAVVVLAMVMVVAVVVMVAAVVTVTVEAVINKRNRISVEYNKKASCFARIDAHALRPLSSAFRPLLLNLSSN